MCAEDRIAPPGAGAPAASEPQWAVELRKVDDAVAGGDAATMLRAWHSACLEALGSQRWQPMLEVADAALRIGRATGFRIAFAKARQAYHVALHRAQKERAAEGVRRIAEGLAALGDRKTVE